MEPCSHPAAPFARGVALLTLAALSVNLALRYSPQMEEPGAQLIIAEAPSSAGPEVRALSRAPVMRVAYSESADRPSDDSPDASGQSFRLIVEPIVPAPRLPGVPPSAALPPYPLLIPVAGVSADQLVDTFAHPRGEEHDRLHLAIDIGAPTGTPVLAAASGVVVRKMNGGKGGISVYMLDDDGRYIYYYAHLDRFAVGLREGQRVEQGDVIGYVGYTGNAHQDAPHLHFAIWKTRPGRSALGGPAVNPYLALTR